MKTNNELNNGPLEILISKIASLCCLMGTPLANLIRDEKDRE